MADLKHLFFTLLLAFTVLCVSVALPANPDTARIHDIIRKGQALAPDDEARAQRCFREAVRIADSLNFQDEIVMTAILEIASFNTYHAQLDSAIRLSLRGLKYYTEKQDTGKMALMMSRIGDILRTNGMYSKSYDYFHQALSLLRYIHDSALLAMVYNRMAASYYEDIAVPIDTAEKYTLRSLAISKSMNLSKRILNNLNILASIEFRKKNYSKALEMYQQALLIVKDVAPREEPLILANMARNYYDMGNYKKTEELSLRSLELARKYDIPQYIFMACLHLNTLYKSSGNYKKAYEYLDQYSGIAAKLMNQRVLVQLHDFNYQIEIEKTNSEKQQLEYEQKIMKNRLHYTIILSVLLLSLLLSLIGFLIYLQHQRNRIRAMNEKLNQSNVILKRFLSILAHDLRSPFNSILGFSELLNDDIKSFSEDHQVAVKNLYSSSRSTFHLLERLLEWTRLQSGSVVPKIETFLLNKPVHETIALLEPAANLKNITISSDPCSDITVTADPEMIATVIRNLVSNAIKFTPGGGSVRISLGTRGKNALIKVWDNGIGMEEEVIGKLFKLEENFKSRGTNGETDTGLGLILCKEYIQMHGGMISIVSEPGKGSEFTVELPVLKGY